MLIVAVMLVTVTTSAALAVGAGTKNGQGNGKATQSGDEVQDTNNVGMGDIRRNYFKRYPFAKFSDEADQVQNGESTGGGSLNISDPAYKSVTVKCDYFSDKGSLGKKHEHYKQDQQQVSGDVATQRDTAISKGWVSSKGLPISDTMYQVIDRENKQRLLELFFDPERWMWKETTTEHMKTTSAANSSGAAAETSFRTAFNVVRQTLINVANERAAVPTSGTTGGQTFEEAVFIVQQMYKQIFVPMAILFLLPGAVLTQVKGLVTRGFLKGDEDSANPFTGMIRALIAIFLIPATQLIVSYSIDVGNALAWEIRDPSKHWIDDQALLNWASEQTFNPPVGNVKNAIAPPNQGKNFPGGGGQQGQPAGSNAAQQAVSDGISRTGNTKPEYRDQRQNGTGGPESILQGGSTGGGGGPFGISTGPFINPAAGNSFISALNDFFNFLFGQPGLPEGSETNAVGGEGKAAGQVENKVIKEDQLWLSGAMQAGFNSSAYFMGYGLTVLGAYQIVFMCYLFLLGPIAACFYAWPSGIGTLFKKVFSNWLDAVVVLALWRFWWCVILAVMTQRLAFVHPNPGSPSEMMVFNCFLALLLYVPFQPFNFHPGPIVAKVLEKAASGGAGGGGGAAGGGSPAPGTQTGNTAPGNQTPGAQPAPGTQHQPQGGPEKGGKDGQGSGDGEPGSESQGPSSGNKDGGGDSNAGGPPSAGGDQNAAMVAAPPMTMSSTAVASSVQPGSAPPMSRTASSSAAHGQNAAVAAVRSGAGNASVEAVPPGSPPTVALSPRGTGPKVLVNSSKPAQAQAAFQSWQQAASSGGSLRAIAAPPPNTTKSAPDGSDADTSEPPATNSGVQAPVNVDIHVNVSGGNQQQQGQPNSGSQVSAAPMPPTASPQPGRPVPPPPLTQNPPANF
jgi:hypothetical protein